MEGLNTTSLMEVANSTVSNITSNIENITVAVATTITNVTNSTNSTNSTTLEALNDSKLVNITGEFGYGDIDAVVIGYLFIAVFCMVWIVS